MDLRRLRAGEWMAAAAGLVLVASLFGPWYVRVLPSVAAPAPTDEVSAWEAFTVVDVLLLASGVIGISLLVVVAVQRTAAIGIAAESLAFLVTAPIAVVALIRVANVPDALDTVSSVDRTPFALLGLLAALAVPVAALVAMRDERRSAPGRPTDTTGLPVDTQPEIEALSVPPRGNAT